MTYMNYSFRYSYSNYDRGGKDWWSRVCGVNYTPSYCSYDMRCKPDYVIDSNNPNAIFGSEGADYANLTSGSDLYFGRDGDDTIIGREGPDTIHGGAGNDYIEGNDADDLLIGGIGRSSAISRSSAS